MSQLSFGNIILAQNGKKGVITPDADGYYFLNAGGFNIPNRHGIVYKVNDYLEECMHPESDLRRRIERGEVYAEAGHPPMYFLERVNGMVVRTPITDLVQWINRLKTIEMDRACGHISDIIFDTSKWRPRSNAPIETFLKIKPYLSTVYGRMFEENLKTPQMNTSMSIRTVTSPLQAGSKVRNVEYFTNFDWVWEPGMANANKHQTAGVESFSSELVFDNRSELIISEDRAIQVIEAGLAEITNLKSVEGVEAYENIQSVLTAIKKSKSDRQAKRIIKCDTSPLNLF